MFQRKSYCLLPRRGSAAVECAVILPLVVLLALGALELGSAIVAQHTLEEAARAGCRIHTVKEATTEQVKEIVKQSLTNAGITEYEIELDPPVKSDAIGHMQPLRVSVAVDYSQVSWMPGTWFMTGKKLVGTAVMPADTGEVAEEDDDE